MADPVAIKMTLSDILNWIIDWIWPKTNRKEGGGTPPFSDYVKDTNPEYLAAIETAVEKLITEEEERKRTVDLKGISLLGLIPIATTILVAVTVAVINSNIEQEENALQYNQWLVLAIYGSSAYTALQPLRAMLAAINGQAATAYLRMTFPEIQPQPGESVSDHKARIVDSRAEINIYNQLVTNKKVDQLNLAHRAIKNALFGIAILTAATIIQGVLIAVAG